MGLEVIALIYFRCRKVERKTHRLARFVKKIKNRIKQRRGNQQAFSDFDGNYMSAKVH